PLLVGESEGERLPVERLRLRLAADVVAHPGELEPREGVIPWSLRDERLDRRLHLVLGEFARPRVDRGDPGLPVVHAATLRPRRATYLPRANSAVEGPTA